jgi:uncharacterized caspase-like protein
LRILPEIVLSIFGMMIMLIDTFLDEGSSQKTLATIDLAGRSNAHLLLIDKSRDEILGLLNDLRIQLAGSDNLLLYFAGHGTRTEQRGYWIPISARRDRPFTFIMDAEISEQIAHMKAKHVLIVSDSCYSAAMYRAEESGKAPPLTDDERSRYLEDAVNRASRRLLTSGSDEPVVDDDGSGHSVFADEFLNVLRTMQPSRFTEEELYLRLKPRVLARSQQTPTTRAIPNVGDREGQFVFTRLLTSQSR